MYEPGVYEYDDTLYGVEIVFLTGNRPIRVFVVYECILPVDSHLFLTLQTVYK